MSEPSGAVYWRAIAGAFMEAKKMSEPTIRLPLREHPDGFAVDMTSSNVPLPRLISLVNSQAERIRGLEEALACVADYVDITAKMLAAFTHYETTAAGLRVQVAKARAVLDKAGKEGA